MFDDFYFEDIENKFQPWDVKSLEEFRYYCCPECPSKYANKTDFIQHAVTSHPQSQFTIEVLEDNKANIKSENVSNAAEKHEKILSCSYNLPVSKFLSFLATSSFPVVLCTKFFDFLYFFL